MAAHFFTGGCMENPELYAAEDWDGVERRAGGANPMRIAVVFDREEWMARMRSAQGEYRVRPASDGAQVVQANGGVHGADGAGCEQSDPAP
jgi:hypothetical protein